MGRIRKLLALVLTIVMVVSATAMPVGASALFTDVKSGDWYHDSVMRWADAGILNGYEDGAFRPTDPVTRGEFAAILTRVLGLKEQAENIFADVKEDDWFAPYVLACVKAGIVDGFVQDGRTVYSADTNINRQEAIKMYVTALKLTGGSDGAVEGFPDAEKVAPWARGYVNTILGYGAMQGRPDGSLAPTDNISRGEVAIILDRLVGVYVSEKGVVSVTTEAEEERAGNLVVVHGDCDTEISIQVEGGKIVVGNLVVAPTNGKVPAVIASGQTLEVEDGVKVTVSDAGIGTEKVPEESKPEESEPTDATEPEETEPSATEPEETEPSVTDPTEPEESEPPVTDPTEPEETEPPVTDPTEPEETEPPVTEPTEPEETEPPVTDPTEPEETEPPVTEPTEPEETEPPATEPEISEKPGTSITVGIKANPNDLFITRYVAYCVNAGRTRLDLNAGEQNYFVFEPEEPGRYTVTTSDPNAVISYWGSSFSTGKREPDGGITDNAFCLNVKEKNLGSDYVIGITGADSCILEILKIGEAILDESDLEYREYEAKTEVTKYTLPSHIDPKNMTPIDVKASTDSIQLYLNEEDGYYHVNSVNGPVLYMNLKTGTPYSLYEALNSSSFYKIVCDQDGKALYKENYRMLIEQYWTNSDGGLYPVTEDLRYIVENGGEGKGWWDKANPNSDYWYSPETGYGKNLNPELAWMFSCCYAN